MTAASLLKRAKESTEGDRFGRSVYRNPTLLTALLYSAWTGRTMGRDSVISVLRLNTDRVVEMHFPDGEIQTARVILVDDDGVVYDLIDSNRARQDKRSGQHSTKSRT